MRMLFSLSFFLFFKFCVLSQQHVYLHFIPKVAGNTLITQTTVQDLQGIEMSIDFFNYYISNLHIIHDNLQDLDLSENIYLVKMDNYNLDLGLLNITTVSQLNFSVGVPYALNHLDISKYESEHPLSYQTPSMYWGWSAGYAHMIVNGTGDGNDDGIPESTFQLNNFGDLNIQNVVLSTLAIQTNPNQLDIYIYCNLDEWIYGANPGNVGVMHGSTGINESVMNNVESRNVFQPQYVAGIEKKEILKGTLQSFVTENQVKVCWSELNDASNFSLIDINGRTIETGKMVDKQGENYFSNLSNGSYIFVAYSDSGDKLNQLRIVK